MDSTLKKRLIGATVLIALAVIFLPMLVQEPAPDAGVGQVPLAIPGEPNPVEQTRELPLQLPTTGETAPPLEAIDDTSKVVAVDADAPVREDALAGHEPPTAPTTGAGPTPEAPTASTPANDTAPSPTAAPASTTANPAPVVAREPQTPPPAKPSAATASEAAGKPAPAKPSPPPLDAGSGAYAVNLGAYANIANAEKLVADLRAAKLTVESTPLQIGGKPALRLRLGPYPRRSDAEQARLRALAVRHDLPATVVAVETAPAKAQASPAEPPRVGYVVQLGAFRDAADADALLARLRQAGFTGLRDSVPGTAGPLFRVRAGPTVTRADADRLRTEIAGKMQIEGIVLGHP